MWKEKYEALKKEFDEFRSAAAQDAAASTVIHAGPAQVVRGVSALITPSDLDAIYVFVRAKLTQEIQAGDGLLAHVLMDVPEIEVTRQRRKLQMSGTETQGRIAVLITEKFFDTPQQPTTVLKEFKRRGWFGQATPSTNLFAPLNKITEMGFLVCEGKDYQAVPGMKINIVEG
jgi:hypothetical protein